LYDFEVRPLVPGTVLAVGLRATFVDKTVMAANSVLIALALAQEVAASAQAFARSALASEVILQFSGALALESAGTPSEKGA
jgi:hypothetical protein